MPINTAPVLSLAPQADVVVQVDSVNPLPMSTHSDIDGTDTLTFYAEEVGTGTFPTFMTYAANVLTIAPNSNDQMGVYNIIVSVTDDNSVTDLVNGVLSHVDTFTITITPLNHPCNIDTSTTVLTGYYFLMDEIGKKIPLPPPSMYGDPDTLDSHVWSFASAGGLDMDYWITVDGAVAYAEFDLTN